MNQASQSNPESASVPVPQVERKVSIDAFRGMIMFLMLAEMLHLYSLAELFPGNFVFEWIRFHTTHVAWEGCSLHDLIQPGFTFLVGVAMPFSIASRLKRNTSTGRIIAHAGWRAFVLIALGIVLRSLGSSRTIFTFEDTLTQIGMGYFFVVLIALCPRWFHYASAFGILALFWAAFALSPAPSPEFDYPAVGVPESWPHHHEGFASRWNKNSNLSWQVDVWFMNLFPRDKEFTFNDGGYSTLSFIPTCVTMLFGLIAGVWMRDTETWRERFKLLLAAAVIGIVSGWVLTAMDISPLVKRIWTPSFTLYSGGICMGWLLALHYICDIKRFRAWVFPFLVIGANSILIYVLSWTVAEPLRDLLLRHLGETPFAIFGSDFVPLFSGAATLGILFYVLLWLYRRRVFIKI